MGPWLRQTSRNGSIRDKLLGQGFVGWTLRLFPISGLGEASEQVGGGGG